MQQGDFTNLAADYRNRPGYSPRVLTALSTLLGTSRPGFAFADIGAGTGKLTSQLVLHCPTGTAVEPNAAMRQEGVALGLSADRLSWVAGSAECTGLGDQSVDWVTMASAFHWADAPVALREFNRILKPGGHLTVLWNPRDLESCPLQAAIEERIRLLAPEVKRVSSGSARHMAGIEARLQAGALFADPIQIEATAFESMTRERYMGAWRSVNDLQAQVGPERFAGILAAIEIELEDRQNLNVPYRTRSWTVRRA